MATKAKYNFDEIVLIEALNNTWDAIGGDVLGSVGEDASMSRSHVIEVVLDASYLEQYGFGIFHGKCEDKNFIEFNKLSYDEKIKFCKKAFPYKTYGW